MGFWFVEAGLRQQQAGVWENDVGGRYGGRALRRIKELLRRGIVAAIEVDRRWLLRYPAEVSGGYVLVGGKRR